MIHSQETLRKHQADEREYVYSWIKLERAAIHEPPESVQGKSVRYSGRAAP